MKRSSTAGWVLAVVLAAVSAPPTAGAVTGEIGDARVSVNGYLDLQYTYMGRLPQGTETAPGVFAVAPTPADPISTLGQERMNLILRVDEERYRATVNLRAAQGVDGDTHSTGGRVEVMEAYGEYRRDERFSLRGGTFLTPFGIYNEFRYAISLFAPVVLATVYAPPDNYADSGGLAHVAPDNVNLMAAGALGRAPRWLAYAVYVGAGDRTATGTDPNEDKAVGGRLTARLAGGRRSIGVSYYTAKDPQPWGRHRHTMASLDLWTGQLHTESEMLWVRTSTDAADVFAWYVRLSRPVGRATPFIGLDFFRDDANPIYARGMRRWSAGAGYEATSHLYLKAEYHYHTYPGAAIPDAADAVHMVRLAAIMVF